MADAFPIRGQIDPRVFPFLVVELHRRGSTGSLKVEGPSYHKALYFRSGRVLFGSSNDPRDQLGAILIEGGKITAEQLADVNAKVGPGNPLAKVLSDTGFVSQRELSEAARAKVERILSDVLTYTSGTFEFEDGVLPKGAVDLKLATERVVMAAVRRVTDRNFVLRHIDGLDAVLGPTAEMVPRLPEVETEAGGLPQHLDGRRTLKEAAASAHLEEFEAAKIASGLLFLGLVERVPATVRASAADAVTFGDVDSGSELDLGATAASALSPEAAVVVPTVEPEPTVTPADDGEPPLFVTGGESQPTPSFSDLSTSEFTFAPAASAATSPEPKPAPAPEPPRASAAETVAPPPEAATAHAAPMSAEPEMAISSPPPAVGAAAEPTPPPLAESPAHAEATASPAASTGTSAALPLIMPERGRPSRSRASAPPPEPRMPTRQNRPSKEDLAALDELLNARSTEGPLTPLEKPHATERWAPQFTRSGGGRRSRSSGRGALLLGMAAVLLGLAAAAWFYLSRLPGPAGHVAAATAAPPASPAAPPPARAGARAGAPAVPPEARPSATMAANATAPPAASLPAATLPAAGPTPRRPPAASGAAPDARALLRTGSFPEAARAFATSTRAAARGAAVIQLLIACSSETVQKAVDNANAPELFILPVNFKGRDCYRLVWGLYPSEARASAALRTVPEYFRSGGASPKVLGASEVAP